MKRQGDVFLKATFLVDKGVESNASIDLKADGMGEDTVYDAIRLWMVNDK